MTVQLPQIPAAIFHVNVSTAILVTDARSSKPEMTYFARKEAEQ